MNLYIVTPKNSRIGAKGKIPWFFPHKDSKSRQFYNPKYFWNFIENVQEVIKDMDTMWGYA